MIPAEKWWGIIGAYGSSIWPAQIISITIAIALGIYLFVMPGKKANQFVRIYLSFSFAWIGIVFFIIQGKELTGNYFFGTLFTLSVIFRLDFSISPYCAVFNAARCYGQDTFFHLLCTD